MNIYVQMNEEEFERYKSKQKPKELHEYSVPELAFAMMEAIRRNGGRISEADSVSSTFTPATIKMGKLIVDNVSFCVTIEQEQNRRSNYANVL